MKIIGSIAIAAALAASTASAANAGGWGGGPYGGPGPYGYGQGPYHHRPHGPAVVYRDSGNAGGALLAGAFLGLAFGAIASQSMAPPPPPAPEPDYLPPPRPNLAAVNRHVAWCSQTYRSYNAERDTFFDFRGIERVCLDPYQQ
jgi:hypothetical protein